VEVSLGDLSNICILVAARSKACVCGLWLLGLRVRIQPAALMSVFSVVCCQGERSLRRADHSSREVLPSVGCLECDIDASIMGRPWHTGACCVVKNMYVYMTHT